MISARGLGGLVAIGWPALSRRRGRTSLGTSRPAQPTAGGPALSGCLCQAAISRGSAGCGGCSAGAAYRPDDTPRYAPPPCGHLAALDRGLAPTYFSSSFEALPRKLVEVVAGQVQV